MIALCEVEIPIPDSLGLLIRTEDPNPARVTLLPESSRNCPVWNSLLHSLADGIAFKALSIFSVASAAVF